jgi:hypothetical protein
MFGWAARIAETTCWTFDASQLVGSLATTWMLLLSAGRSHFCQPADSGLPGKPPMKAMSPDLTYLFMIFAYARPSLQTFSPTTVV